MKTTVRWWPDGAQGAPAVFEVLEDDGWPGDRRAIKPRAGPKSGQNRRTV